MSIVTFTNPWAVDAYGQTFIGATAQDAMTAADAFGERNQLRAVSLVARRVVPATTTPAPGPARMRTVELPLRPLDETGLRAAFDVLSARRGDRC